jgi:hypothetical protein
MPASAAPRHSPRAPRRRSGGSCLVATLPCRASVAQPPLELIEIQSRRSQLQGVAVARRCDHAAGLPSRAGGQDSTQARDVRPHGAGRRPGDVPFPQAVDQALKRNLPSTCQQQHGQHGPLMRRSQLKLRLPEPAPYRPEHFKLHHTEHLPLPVPRLSVTNSLPCRAGKSRGRMTPACAHARRDLRDRLNRGIPAGSTSGRRAVIVR